MLALFISAKQGFVESLSYFQFYVVITLCWKSRSCFGLPLFDDTSTIANCHDVSSKTFNLVATKWLEIHYLLFCVSGNKYNYVHPCHDVLLYIFIWHSSHQLIFIRTVSLWFDLIFECGLAIQAHDYRNVIRLRCFIFLTAAQTYVTWASFNSLSTAKKTYAGALWIFSKWQIILCLDLYLLRLVFLNCTSIIRANAVPLAT